MTQLRQPHLDSLRGVAAFIVVIVHYLAAFYPYTVFGNQGNYTQHSWWEPLAFIPPFGIFVGGHFAVCLFFILSGYVLSYGSIGEPKQHQKLLGAIIKRPVRLGGLVLFTVLCGGLLWYGDLYFNNAVSNLSSSQPWFKDFWPNPFDLKLFVKDISTSLFSRGSTYNPPLWSIKIELYGSIFVYMFLFLFGNFKYRLPLISLLLFLCRGNLYQGFWIGVLFAELVKFHKSYITIPRSWWTVLLLLFLYFSSYPKYTNNEFLDDTIYCYLPEGKSFGGGYPMLSAILLFVLLISSDQFQSLLNKPIFLYLGRISYGLYVVHFLIIGSFSSWLFLFINDYYNYSVSFFITLVVGLIVIVSLAHTATKFIDEPAIKFSNFFGKKINEQIMFMSTIKCISKCKIWLIKHRKNSGGDN
jgi:peptidoglycan/LPS O-acetylase OafA/YrhL